MYGCECVVSVNVRCVNMHVSECVCDACAHVSYGCECVWLCCVHMHVSVYGVCYAHVHMSVWV